MPSATMSRYPAWRGMTHHVERKQLAEELGFSAIWLRDVPFNVPTFWDAGQLFDPLSTLVCWLRKQNALHWECAALCYHCVILYKLPRQQPVLTCYRVDGLF